MVGVDLEKSAEKAEGPGREPVMLLCEWSLSTETLKFEYSLGVRGCYWRPSAVSDKWWFTINRPCKL